VGRDGAQLVGRSWDGDDDANELENLCSGEPLFRLS
jgi:hypothetical protein